MVTREEAWAAYFAEHPEIRASWRHQHSYWPMGHSNDPYDGDYDPATDDASEEAGG